MITAQEKIMQKLFKEILIGDKEQTEWEFYAECKTWDSLFNL